MKSKKATLVAAVKTAPEKFTWMKYKGTKAKILTHTKRNGDVVRTRLEPNAVFGYRTVKLRSTGKELIQIVLKSDSMDLAYNLAVRSFNTHILKVSKTTVLPKQFKKPIDTKTIDKKAPAEPKVEKAPAKPKPKKSAVRESDADIDMALKIFEHCDMDDSDIEWLTDQLSVASYSLLGLARFCEFLYDHVGRSSRLLQEDLEGFFSLSKFSGLSKDTVINKDGQPLINNLKNNYLAESWSDSDKEVKAPVVVEKKKPKVKKVAKKTVEIPKEIAAIAKVMGSPFQAAIDTASELGYSIEVYDDSTDEKGFKTTHLLLKLSDKDANIELFAKQHSKKLAAGTSNKYSYGEYRVEEGDIQMIMGDSEALLEESDDQVLSLSITNNPNGF